jgi:hypothetical protein
VIDVTTIGSFQKTADFLKRAAKLDIVGILKANGQAGVNALEKATPTLTGLAADSWGYEVTASGGVYRIAWTNTDVENGFRVVIMLQYGHATGTGGYVQGRDFINPAMKPIFDKIANDVWKAVTSK